MERFHTYFLALLLLPGLPLMAQQKQASTIPASFPDSVKTVLDRTRNADAMRVGAEFSTAWSVLTADQQTIVKRQAQFMRRKKLPLRPYFADYFGALASAVTVERTEASKLRSFLSVTDKVLENEKLPVIASFFKISRTFFQHHALHFEKPFRLYARDDDYTFDYIIPAPTFDLNDPPPLYRSK